MPITFEQPSPVGADVAEGLGFYQQMQKNQELAMQRAQFQAAQQQHADAMAMQAAQMGQQAYQFEASQQPSGRDVFHAQVQQQQSEQQFNQALQLHQAQLTQSEQMRMQRLEQTISEIQTARDNNEIDDATARDAIVQARTGLDPLQRRHSQAQLQQQQLQLQQMQRLNQHQDRMFNMTQAERATYSQGLTLSPEQSVAIGLPRASHMWDPQHGRYEQIQDPHGEMRNAQLAQVLERSDASVRREVSAGNFQFTAATRAMPAGAARTEAEDREIEDAIWARSQQFMRRFDRMRGGSVQAAPTADQLREREILARQVATNAPAPPPGQPTTPSAPPTPSEMPGVPPPRFPIRGDWLDWLRSRRLAPAPEDNAPSRLPLRREWIEWLANRTLLPEE